jgi:hypothetical protein
MAMTLYDWPRSGHAHRIRLFMSILGVPYESVNVDLMKGEHKDPEYRKLSPLGQVPTLVDGDTVITDSTAAMRTVLHGYNAGYLRHRVRFTGVRCFREQAGNSAGRSISNEPTASAIDSSNGCSRNSQTEPGWLPIMRPSQTLPCIPI